MRRTLGILLGLVIGVAIHADASTISITAGAGLAGNTAALDAFNRAANTLGSLFSDPITILVNGNFVNLGSPSIIGQTSATLLQGGYATIRNQMVGDAADEPGDAIVAALPTDAQFSAFVPAGFTLSGNIYLTQANAMALGFGRLTPSDGNITFNSSFAFDFDNSDGVGAGLVDFETVALHELVHLMGFISAVDDIDFLMSQRLPGAITFTTLDLFRFANSNLPGDAAAFTNNPRSLVPNTAASTSDTLNTWAMSTGVFTGDGRQASHWKDDSLTGIHIGVMDPTLSNAVAFGMTAADIRALDLIGWDVAAPPPAAVPEPASMILFGSGAALLVRLRKRRSSSVH